MALDVLKLVMNSLSFLTFIIVTPLLVYYCHILLKTTPTENQERTTIAASHNKGTYKASICGIICFVVACVSYFIMFIVWFVQYSFTEESHPLYIILWDGFGLLAYVSGIWTMLLTFLMRIDYAFRNSFLAYSLCLIRCLYAYIVVIGITMLLVVLLYAITHDTLRWIAPLCVFEIVSYDIILLYLLFTKLFRIFALRGVQKDEGLIGKEDQDNPQQIVELDTLETTTIYSTLILLGVISTFVFATMLALQEAIDPLDLPGGVLIGLDIYVNGTCLFLMFGINKERYNKYCSKYHSCLQSCCINCTYKGDIVSKKTKEEYINLVLADAVAL